MTLRERLDELDSAVKLLSEAIERELRPSILKGKVAIQVNNEREFKLLMEHYEGRGWKWRGNLDPMDHPVVINQISYGNPISYWSANDCETVGIEGIIYKSVPFSDFAKEVGIKVPVKILTSEDGVDLYEGDVHECARLNPNGKWEHACQQRLRPDQLAVKEPQRVKAFSTKEAAEKWIEEQNKPKKIKVKLYRANGNRCAVVDKDGVHLKGYSEIISFKHCDIEDIMYAIQSLQCDKTVNE